MYYQTNKLRLSASLLRGSCGRYLLNTTSFPRKKKTEIINIKIRNEILFPIICDKMVNLSHVNIKAQSGIKAYLFSPVKIYVREVKLLISIACIQ